MNNAGKIKDFLFLPKTYLSRGILKRDSLTRQNLWQNPDFSTNFWNEMTLYIDPTKFKNFDLLITLQILTKNTLTKGTKKNKKQNKKD